MKSSILPIFFAMLTFGACATNCPVREVAQTCYASNRDCGELYTAVKQATLDETHDEQAANVFAEICAAGCVSRRENYEWYRVRDAVEPICIATK